MLKYSAMKCKLLILFCRGILYEDGEWKVKTTPKPTQTRKPKREKFELGKQ